MKLNELTIKEAAKKLRSGEITSVQLTEDCLSVIEKLDGKIKACLTVCREEALREAAEADIRLSRGEKGELLGIPYLAKDNILTKGVRTTASSKILENYIAPFDATIVKKLREAGAVLLGKTNLDEFAHGASTDTSAFGTTHNPWDLERVPGGSSGGSAAAVAADMCIFALGTDTGGSIRHPASFCGVVGLKPSYGRASRFGLLAMTSSTDVPGPITKTVEDAAIVMKVISGLDKNDSTTVDESVESFDNFGAEIKGLKIGLPREFFTEGINEEVKKVVDQVIEKFKELGAEIMEVSLPHTKYGIPAYYIITPSEICSNLARYDGIKYGFSTKEAADLKEIYTKSRGQGFGSEVKRRIMLGTYALSAGYYDAYYLQAQKVRTKIKQELDEVLNSVDCILTPTSPHTAFKIGDKVQDPLKMYLEDIFVTSPSLAGVPAMSIPAGFAQNLPVGIQLIAKRFGEDKLLKFGKAYQDATDWHKQKAEL